MNTGMNFDSLAYYERLVAAGMPEGQAKVQVSAIQDVVASYDASLRQDLATKADIVLVRTEIQQVKFELLKWMVGLAVAQMALIVALIAFIK